MKEQTRPFKKEATVLVLGGTGFIGRRLVRDLLDRGARCRLLVRSPEKARAMFQASQGLEVLKGDLLTGDGLSAALEGAHTAYYLVHSMGGRSIGRNVDFIKKDRQAAEKFISAAGGLSRVIYLGGLGEAGDKLSEHLRSRVEVAEILKSGVPLATVLRAAVIIGAGGASFEMLRYLVERLPVMICPRWIDTKIQPIAVADVVRYLSGCLMIPETAGRTFDICGPEVLTYREMMHQYAEARGLAKRLIITVPVLTPELSALWVDLVTPVPSGIAHPLIEGLRNEVVCKDPEIERLIHIKKTPFKEAVKTAFGEETEGPGVTGF